MNVNVNVTYPVNETLPWYRVGAAANGTRRRAGRRSTLVAARRRSRLPGNPYPRLQMTPTSVAQAFCSTIGSCSNVSSIASSLEGRLRALLGESDADRAGLERCEGELGGSHSFQNGCIDRLALSRWLGPTFTAELQSLPSTMRAAASPSADRTSIDFVIADCNELTPIQLQMLIAAQVPLGSLLSGSWRVFLYHKCGRSKWDGFHSAELWQLHQEDLPNVGFESHTYLHHITAQYGHLAQWTLFLQGGYLVHSSMLSECALDWASLNSTGGPQFLSFVDSIYPPYPDLTPLDLTQGTTQAPGGEQSWADALDDILHTGTAVKPQSSQKSRDSQHAGQTVLSLAPATALTRVDRSKCLRGITESAQIAVHERRLTSRPREFYQGIMHVLAGTNIPRAIDAAAKQRAQDGAGKNLAKIFEGTWHVIMGEEACLERDAVRLRLAPLAKEQTDPLITWKHMGAQQNERWSRQHEPRERPMRTACQVVYQPSSYRAHSVPGPNGASGFALHDVSEQSHPPWQLDENSPWRGYVSPLIIALLRSYPRRTETHPRAATDLPPGTAKGTAKQQGLSGDLHKTGVKQHVPSVVHVPAG